MDRRLRPLAAAPRRLHLVEAKALAVSSAPADEATDEERALVEGLRRGETRAAAAIWDRFAPFVRGLLVRTLGPCTEVDDLVQDVFLRLFERLPGLRDPGALRGYTAIVALSAARSELRRRRVRRLVGLGTPEPEPGALPADLPTRQALVRLHDALDRLKADDRLVFCLRYIEAMELTEIAGALGLSLATTKRHLARAKRRVWVLAERDPTLAPYLVAGGDDIEGGST